MSSAEFHHPFESVDKFGGTSMAQPHLVEDIVRHQLPESSIIVVSAPGRDASAGINVKMTDQLIEYAATQDPELRDEIIDRFDHLYTALPLADRVELKDALYRELTPIRHFGGAGNHDELYFASRGELFSALYFGRAIGARVLEPAVVFDGAGNLNRRETSLAICSQLSSENGGNVVIPGFFGLDQFNRTWTLDRGGSDRTGALYSAALDRDYTNWTDVDGIFSANPSNVPDARVIRSLTREEVREGAHGGSGVLQGDAIVDLNGSEVVTTVRNTLKPSVPGTRVVAYADRLDPRESDVVSVTGRDDLVRVGIKDLGMRDKHGYIAELLGEFARQGFSLEQAPMAQDSASLTFVGVPSAAMEFANFARSHHLSGSSAVTVEQQGIVYIVGEALRAPKIRRKVLQHALVVADQIEAEEALPTPNKDAPSIALITQVDETHELVCALHAELIC